MKERPIIFSGPMVRAILEGRKTQTRRVVKPHCKNMVYDLSGAWVDPGGSIWGPGPYLKVPVRHVDDTFDDGITDRVFCPYGPAGTRLWVRETWALLEHGLGLASPSYCIDAVYKASIVSEYTHTGEVGFSETSTKVVSSSADTSLPDGSGKFSMCTGQIRGILGKVDRWRPSIHMPRWASRILLEVTDVGVERVQDISEGDAKAEGGNMDYDSSYNFHQSFNYRGGFMRLWDSINAKRGYGWDENPWVWVVSFKRIEP